MKTFTLFALAILFSVAARAQLMFKNTKAETYQVAVAVFSDTKDFKGWISKGWFRLNPGDSAAVSELSGPTVCYFLHTLDNKVSEGGTKAFLVDKKDAFAIKGADLKATEKRNPAYIWQNFHELKVPEDARKSLRLMVLL